jgi:uncharacterized protein YwqG
MKLLELFRKPKAQGSPAPTVDDVLARLGRHRRRAWLPRTEAGPTSLDGSKFGGLPLLAAGETWPECGNCRKPMQLFLQLDGGALPADAGLPLGGRLVQLFYCTTAKPHCESACEAWAAPGVSTRLRLIDAATAPQPLTASPVAGAFPERRIVGWDALDDYPNAEDAAIAGEELDDVEAEILMNAGYPREKDKLAGWPYWMQSVSWPACPECTRPMRPLFQLDSNGNLPYMFGDAGVLHLFLCPDHTDRLGMNWDCA